MRTQLAATAAFAACLGHVAPALAGDGHNMYAYAAIASSSGLSYGGQAVPDQTIGGVSGKSANGAYRQANSILSTGQTWYLPGAGAPGFSLNVTGATTVAAGAPRVGSVQDQATASFNIQTETLNLVPPVGHGPEPLLSVTITGAAGGSYLTTMPDGYEDSTAYVSVGAVTLTGSVLGPRVITAPANAPPNTVLYQSGNLLVIVNSSSGSCAGGLGVIGGCFGSSVAAVVVEFSGDVYGKQITGNIGLGYTETQELF